MPPEACPLIQLMQIAIAVGGAATAAAAVLAAPAVEAAADHGPAVDGRQDCRFNRCPRHIDDARAGYLVEFVTFQLADFAVVSGIHGSVSISQCGGPSSDMRVFCPMAPRCCCEERHTQPQTNVV